MSKADFVFFATLCWAAWFSRNTVIFEANIPQPLEIARGMMVNEYVEYAHKVFVPKLDSRVSGICKWSPPHEGFVKLNVDAHIMENVGVGLGVVARNSMGQVVGMVVCRCSARWEAPMAEAATIKFGTMVASRLGLRQDCGRK